MSSSGSILQKMSDSHGLTQQSQALPRDAAAPSSNNGWLTIVLIILAIRAIVFLTGVLSVATVHSISQVDPSNASGNSWIAFDCHFYRYILVNGYPPGPEIPYQIAYFPFLPLAGWIIKPLCAAVLGTDAAPRAALLLVANVCSVVGLCFFYAWARLILAPRTAMIAVLLLAVYPGSVFFCAGETEGPFLMFAAIAIYLLQKQRLYSAAMVSAVGTACRPTAVCLALTVVLWTIYYSWHLPYKQLIARVLIIGTLSVLGGLSYEAFLWHGYGHYDAFKRAEDKWDLDKDPIQSAKNQQILQGVDQKWTFANGTSAAEPDPATVVPKPAPRRYSLAFFRDHLVRPSVWNYAIAFGVLILTLIALCRPANVSRILLILPLAIFIMSYLPNWGLRCSSIARYETPAIPLFAVIALWLSPPSRRGLLLCVMAISFAVQLYYAYLYSRGFWVG